MQPPNSGQKPELAGVKMPSASALPYFIGVRWQGNCAISDCAAEIALAERALYDREYGNLYCLRCTTLWILRGAADKPADDRQRAIRVVCRLYEVETPDALPSAIRVAALGLLNLIITNLIE